MNDKNLQYLKDNLKYMGFGDKLNESLEANMLEERPSFDLQIDEKMHYGHITAKLHFRQSPSTGMYFFNSFQAHLVNENGFERSQQFYLNNGKGVTLKEAYNLLNGRSVFKDMTNKEGIEYKAWLKLDFDDKKDNGQYQLRHFHSEKYGFDLKKELDKLHLSPLSEEKEKQLIQSLEKGNRQAANFQMEGERVVLHYIEANPQFKTINIYDADGKQLSRFDKEQLMADGKAMEVNDAQVILKVTSGKSMGEELNGKSLQGRELKAHSLGKSKKKPERYPDKSTKKSQSH